MVKNGQKGLKRAKNCHALINLAYSLKKIQYLLSVPIAQLVKALQRCFELKVLSSNPNQGKYFFKLLVCDWEIFIPTR